MSAVAMVKRPQIRVSDQVLDESLLQRIPAAMARRLGVLLLGFEHGSARVAMRDPRDVLAQDEVSRLLGTPVRALQADPEELDSVLACAYRRTGEIRRLAAALQRELEARRHGSGDATPGLDTADDAPVVQLLENIFADALQTGSSDVHLQPVESGFRIRYRVDGFLSEQLVERPAIYAAVVLRLKLMAEMDISERRLPQDGRLTVDVGSERLHVRVATMPDRHGEAVVLRIAAAPGAQMDLADLGLCTASIRRIESVLADPHGMIAVVGPTGSGKTTTLNALLARLDTENRKLITVEDPVECRLERAVQVQVNPRIGLGFSEVLRSALRHDPDVLMVGEIRDRETAEIATRAALTGHLVLTTVHCNDAAGCEPRLIDIGVAPFMLSSALRLVIGQRLLRRVCSHCSEAWQPTPALARWLEELGQTPASAYRLGRGCNRCRHSGYHGRIGVYEIVEPGPHPRGTPGLLTAALKQAAQGHTSLIEVMRVFGSPAGEEA